MMQKEELEQIERTLISQISEEVSDNFNPKSLQEDYVQFGTLLDRTVLLRACHTLYHTVEEIQDCQTASNSIVVKAFLMGYSCRKAIQEENELEKLVSAATA